VLDACSTGRLQMVGDGRHRLDPGGRASPGFPAAAKGPERAVSVVGLGWAFSSSSFSFALLSLV
jgi:hypothetical protein